VFRLKVAKGFENKARLLQRIGMSLVKHKCIIFFVLESLKCFQMSRGYISPLCRLMYENSMLPAMVEVKHCRSMTALKKFGIRVLCELKIEIRSCAKGHKGHRCYCTLSMANSLN